MARVKLDLVDGHEFDVGKDGAALVQWYKVFDLTPGPNILLDAYAALQGIGIDYGTERSGYGGLFVTRIKPRFNLKSRTQAKVMVEWKTSDPNSANPSETIINFHGTTRELPTERRYDRSIIQVFYQAPSESFYRKEVGRVTGTKATGILECIREVPYDPTSHLQMLNKVNGSPYRDQDKWTWFVRDIDISKILHRPGWKETIQIEYDQETFRKAALFVDSNTGGVPADIVANYDPDSDSGNGYENVLVQGEADLNDLGIPHTAGSF